MRSAACGGFGVYVLSRPKLASPGSLYSILNHLVLRPNGALPWHPVDLNHPWGILPGPTLRRAISQPCCRWMRDSPPVAQSIFQSSFHRVCHLLGHSFSLDCPATSTFFSSNLPLLFSSISSLLQFYSPPLLLPFTTLLPSIYSLLPSTGPARLFLPILFFPFLPF